MAEVFEEVRDLRRGDSIEGKRRDVVFGEELGVGGFIAALRGAADHFAEEEKFVGMEGVGRMAVQVAVKDGGEFGDANFVTGFFTDFAGGGDRRRVADIGPAAREGPAAVFDFTDEKEAIVLEGGDASVDFGSGVAELFGENFLESLRVGLRRAGGHHFGGDGADFVIAMNVEFIFAIGEAGLRDSLKAARPGEPLRNGHDDILAAWVGREQVLKDDNPMNAEKEETRIRCRGGRVGRIWK